MDEKKRMSHEEFRAHHLEGSWDIKEPAITPKPKKSPLKPCPFCGWGAELVQCGDRISPLGFFIDCKNRECLCRLGYWYYENQQAGNFGTAEEAIIEWNTRITSGQDNESRGILKDYCHYAGGCAACPDKLACD